MLTVGQVEQRRNSIGGSDVAAVMGLSPWKSALQLWLEKTGATQPDDLSENESVEWGNRLESVVLEKFAENHPELSVTIGQDHLEHSDYPFITASLDGTVVDVENHICPLEIKTASAFTKEWDNDNVPIQYVCQCQTYMAVTGAEKCYLACLIGGQKYVERLILRDDAFIALLLASCVDFWHKVQKCIPPEIDGSESATAALKSIYPSSVAEKCIELDAGIEDVINLKLTYEKVNDEYESMIRTLNNKIKEAMQDAEVGKVGKWQVSYKANKAGNRVMRLREVAE